MKKQNIVSWIALSLSIMACIVTWLRINVTITNDTFVGIMAGFMGACATIIVGAQIYNSIETSKKIKKIEGLQALLKKELEEGKLSRRKSEGRIQAWLYYSHGIAISNHNLFTCYEFLYEALKEALLHCSPDEIRHILHDLKVTVKKIEKQESNNPKNFQVTYSTPPEEMNPQSLSKLPNFPFIKKEYSEIYQAYLNIISKYTSNVKEYEI
jgi:hypothetical protein